MITIHQRYRRTDRRHTIDKSHGVDARALCGKKIEFTVHALKLHRVNQQNLQ